MLKFHRFHVFLSAIFASILIKFAGLNIRQFKQEITDHRYVVDREQKLRHESRNSKKDSRCKNGLDSTSRKYFWAFRRKGRPTLYDAFAKKNHVYIIFSTNREVCDECGLHQKWASGSWSCSFNNVSSTHATVISDKHSRTLVVCCDMYEIAHLPADQIRTVNVLVKENETGTHYFEKIEYCQYHELAIDTKHHLHTLPSHPITLAACTMVKSDLVRFSLPYNVSVLEWIAYHKLQGFQHFYIYANEDPTPLRRLLAPYIADGLVEVVDWQWPTHGYQHQDAQINSCMYRYRGLAKWAAFFDIDEFFQPLAPADTVRTIVERANASIGALRVANMMFFHCEECNLTNEPLQTRKFTFRSLYPEWGRSKMIVRPENVALQLVHTIPNRYDMVPLDPAIELRFNHYKKEVEGFVQDNSMLCYCAAIEEEMVRVGWRKDTS